MTSDPPAEAYVWVWLPGRAGPVVAGRLSRQGRRIAFNYGQSYLRRAEAISLYDPELPLRPGLIDPAPALDIASCIRDGAPDAWGRRVIAYRLAAHAQAAPDLDELTCLLESGSDRAGALDFQPRPDIYRPRAAGSAGLDELLQAADLVEHGRPITPDLAAALLHGTSLGGARPKALIDADGRKFIAKFSSSTDVFPVVKAEFLAMRLAREAGLDVASVQLENAAGRDVLLVERFDRSFGPPGWTRRPMVSALTILGLAEMQARYASYEELADAIRHRFTAPRAGLEELFGRIVFNVLCGNTDDHARNHAAFWDGHRLTLTPAYDICPQPRSGMEASQAMLIHGQDRRSRLATCLAAAPRFLLAPDQAEAIAHRQIAAIRQGWAAACDAARLSEIERGALQRRQFFNPFAFDAAPRALIAAAGSPA